jgi:methanogenic corrinoid protein MtbC1
MLERMRDSHPERTVEPVSTEQLDDLTKKFLAAQLAADRREALRVVVEDGVARGVGVQQLLMDVIRPAQQEIGRLWQANRISIADEHVATAISQLALAQLYPLAARQGATNRRILVACVEGELHDMGARMAADLLDLEGHDVVFLGASLPVDHLVSKVKAEKPDLVVLSITMTFHIAALQTAVARLRRDVTPPPPIAAGGRALGWCPELRSELRLAATGEDARTLIADVQRFFRR